MNMKNRAVVFSLYLFAGAAMTIALVSVFSGCVRVDITNINSRGENIICFGDSLTQGFGAPAGQSYPDMLKRLTRYSVINAGLEGDATVDAARRLKTDVLEREPLLVIIELGANDFLLGELTPEQSVKNVELMIQAIQARGAMVALVDISAGELMADYGKGYRALSRKYKTIFIPRLLEGLIGNPSFTSKDHFHLNADGYTIFAHRVYRAILPYLTRNAIQRRFTP
jgi:lysophospholipase L1-like esterase